MQFDYDDQNIFAKILRGEIPNKTVMKMTTHWPFTTSSRRPRCMCW